MIISTAKSDIEVFLGFKSKFSHVDLPITIKRNWSKWTCQVGLGSAIAVHVTHLPCWQWAKRVAIGYTKILLIYRQVHQMEDAVAIAPVSASACHSLTHVTRGPFVHFCSIYFSGLLDKPCLRRRAIVQATCRGMQCFAYSSCNPDGTFPSRQCNNDTMNCHCEFANGTEIAETGHQQRDADETYCDVMRGVSLWVKLSRTSLHEKKEKKINV